jgi:hypothetical protein
MKKEERRKKKEERRKKKEERSPPSEFPVAFQACQKIDLLHPLRVCSILNRHMGLGGILPPWAGSRDGGRWPKSPEGKNRSKYLNPKHLVGIDRGRVKTYCSLGRTKQRLGVSYALQIQRVGGSIACYGDISPIHHLRPREAVDSSNAFFADS